MNNELLKTFKDSLTVALQMLNSNELLEIRSALKQAASDNGIPYGDEMEKFVLWAEKEMNL